MKVGVNSTRTRSPSTATSFTTPRSTTRDDRDLRIRDLRERLPDRLGGYHCAPAGAERRTIVISSEELLELRLVPRPRHGLGVRQLERQPLPHRRREARPQLVVEHAERVRPELAHALLQPLAPLVGREQPLEPHVRVHTVVDLLAVHLRRQPGDLRVVGRLQGVEADRVGRLVEPVTGDRPRPLEPAQLDERRAAVLLGPAVEGERVGVRAEVARRQLVQRPRVADLVLCDRREGDVLLEVAARSPSTRSCASRG